MNNPLTPVEAITDQIKYWQDVCENDYYKEGQIAIAFAELALADAEFDLHNDSPVKYKALLDARAKLYEALQR